MANALFLLYLTKWSITQLFSLNLYYSLIHSTTAEKNITLLSRSKRHFIISLLENMAELMPKRKNTNDDVWDTKQYGHFISDNVALFNRDIDRMKKTNTNSDRKKQAWNFFRIHTMPVIARTRKIMTPPIYYTVHATAYNSLHKSKHYREISTLLHHSYTRKTIRLEVFSLEQYQFRKNSQTKQLASEIALAHKPLSTKKNPKYSFSKHHTTRQEEKHEKHIVHDNSQQLQNDVATIHYQQQKSTNFLNIQPYLITRQYKQLPHAQKYQLKQNRKHLHRLQAKQRKQLHRQRIQSVEHHQTVIIKYHKTKHYITHPIVTRSYGKQPSDSRDYHKKN
ncbi:unnamed protein product [Didymodactylos carnosus]|uniref:Uncharacterized protein n=1 Tax=Didymodactylos carnosus TaxID=1234261 RepID=A0A813VM41_9BILA|nr:unnamed protein product [Didymodactylos carnosus]CAF0853580.1 unnamed protein product [Didymodactylos carnosus]CAF3632879.1 unnamed protein product [Didymodactylos carnosus]CAF3638745.1 unnamed protein product [Didymodactylos carnosus]